MTPIHRSWPRWTWASQGLRRSLSIALLCCLAVLATGCRWALVSQPTPPGPVQEAPAKTVWIFSFGHSESDQAEEPEHLKAFEAVFLTKAVAEDATVVVFTVGAAGLSSPRLIGKADFNTSAMDGDNPYRERREQAERLKALIHQVKVGLQGLPYSSVSDPFGGFHGAASMLAQYPSAAKRLVGFGDQLANRPEGCVLASRDLSPVHRDRHIQTCSPVPPALRGVQVMLPGAGYSVDDPIPTATAQGLEALLRDFFARSGATLALYGPVALTANTGTADTGRSGPDGQR